MNNELADLILHLRRRQILRESSGWLGQRQVEMEGVVHSILLSISQELPRKNRIPGSDVMGVSADLAAELVELGIAPDRVNKQRFWSFERHPDRRTCIKYTPIQKKNSILVEVQFRPNDEDKYRYVIKRRKV